MLANHVYLGAMRLSTPAEQAAARRREADRKAGAKAAKALAKRTAEEARENRRLEREQVAMPAVTADAIASPTPSKLGVIYMPTPEEAEATREAFAKREADRLAAGRQADVKKTKAMLLERAEKARPPISTFVEWVVQAGFDYSHDDRNAAVYVRDGVEIRAFGAAINPVVASPKRFNNHLTPEQLAAKLRRERLARDRASDPETAVDRAKREANREARRLERQAAQPKKGAGGSKDVHGQGKGDKKGKKDKK